MTADLRAVWSSARGQISNSMARTMMKNVVFMSPLFNVIITYFLFRRSGLPNFGEQVVVGSALMTLWYTILWSSATDLARERWMGTFELLLISPVPFPVVLLGKILGNALLGTVAVLLSYGYARLLFGVTLSVVAPLAFLLTLAGAAFSFVGFSLALALLFTLSRQANNVASGLSYPIYLVSGLLFPLPLLPIWALPLGLAMPLAWAREAVRWASTGPVAAPHLLTHSWGWAFTGLVGIGVFYFTATLLLYRYVIGRKLRELGQLGVA